ncbi:MAG: carboxypeptidase-like regulatory domain-containing protein, partial [Rhodothermaceae bacterium]|nr:carboxypeptidase-like regulatory domain-containing protein [Rhodothermaceae bacterium]
MFRKLSTYVLFLLLALPGVALAQNTGKLSGQVTDATTGDPLPGAQVVVDGTQLGAATDLDGNYVILGIPVGQYDVEARFVGFETERRTG